MVGRMTADSGQIAEVVSLNALPYAARYGRCLMSIEVYCQHFNFDAIVGGMMRECKLIAEIESYYACFLVIFVSVIID